MFRHSRDGTGGGDGKGRDPHEAPSDPAPSDDGAGMVDITPFKSATFTLTVGDRIIFQSPTEHAFEVFAVNQGGGPTAPSTRDDRS
jgi:hypothetical protein